MTWETVIGLEIHVQLNTQSKIFSGASTAFGAEPNAHASVVECALPGTLPVMNREVVAKAIKLGLALNAKINRKNVFDRKNYFYPDLPKGYQISQLDLPIVEHGKLEIVVGDEVKTINVTRAHMEEDAGKSVHEGLDGATGIDLNRAGTPLLEVVSEPEMRSAAEAVAYAKALHGLVTWLDICDGNMAEGSFRVDANVSVRPKGQAEFGTRREIKNLNSFRFLEQAINYEVEAQIEILEDGGKVQQATMLFDPEKGETRVMRLKEDAHDYRYFPDPDLLPVIISDDQMDKARDEMSELQHKIIERFIEDCRLPGYDAYLVTATPAHAELFENSLNFNVLMQVTNGNQQREQIKEGSWLAEILKCIQKLGTKKFNLNQVYQYENELSKIFPNNKHIKAKIRQQLQILREKGLIEFIDNNGNYINRNNGNYINRAKIIANIMNGMLASKLNKEGLELANSPIADSHLDALVGKIADGTLSSKLAKKAFEAMWAEPDATIEQIIDKHGLVQITDTGAIEAMVDEVLANNAKAVEQFKAGNEKALNAIVGQVMKASKGKANPAQVQELVKAKLG